MTTWTGPALTRETTIRQGLAERRPVGVTDAVRSALALQAQDPAAPYLALWNRIEGFDADDLDRAFAVGSVVKASLFRFTLHAVATEDVPWARAALRERARDAGYDSVLDGLGLTSAEVGELLGRMSGLLAEARPGDEIEQLVRDLVPDADDPARVWSAMRVVGSFRNAPTAGPWSFGPRPSYIRCRTAAEDASASTAELVRRYLLAFGPASIADMSQFTILKRSVLRAVVESMPDVVAVSGPDGTSLFDVRDDGAEPDVTDGPLPARLLGMWDSVLLAYADRSRVIPERHRADVIRRNGDVLPTVLVDGLVRGVWRATADAIEVRALDPLDDATLAAIDVEARELRRFVADREPAVFPRVGSWWDRLPDGPTITIG